MKENFYQELDQNELLQVEGGDWVDVAEGAVAGGMAGSMIPGVGTVAGAVVGAIAGAIFGDW